MSKQDEPREDAEFPEEDSIAAAEPPGEVPALPAPEQPSRRGSGGIAWLALFLALLGSAGAGYLIVQDWRERGAADRNASSLAELRDRVASSNASLSDLDTALDEIADRDAAAAAGLEALRAELGDRLELLDSLPSRMSALESSVSSLQGVSPGARDAWLLAEAEYYMQIANAQLQLAGNPYLASLALGMADERVAQVADPALIDVRRALSDELAALDGIEKPDIEGISLTLSSLGKVVASLPLRQSEARRGQANAEVDESLSGFDRAWASVREAASGLVRVTPPDESAAPLMTPDAEYFLRSNLALQMQVARLALLRGEQAVFEQSLDDASDWLATYFDTESTQVRGAQATIEEIRGSVPAVALPDISGSLRLLRQYESIGETAQ